MNSTVVGSEDCLYLNVFTTYVSTRYLIAAFKVFVSVTYLLWQSLLPTAHVQLPSEASPVSLVSVF